MECRVRTLLFLMLAIASWPQWVRARRRVVIEVPVHIRSHQHTHTVYRQLPQVVHHAPAPPQPAAPAAQLQARYAQPLAAQRVAHHAAPGGLTSITLVNLGRGSHAAHADDHPDDQGDDRPDQGQQVRLQRHQPQQQQRHHVTGLNYQRTEHTAQVY